MSGEKRDLDELLDSELAIEIWWLGGVDHAEAVARCYHNIDKERDPRMVHLYLQLANQIQAVRYDL